MSIFKKAFATGLAALILASCGGPPRGRPSTVTWTPSVGVPGTKKQIIFRAYSRKDPSVFIKLLDVTAREVVQQRVKPDTYWYDNRSEQVWTIRFVVNVMAQRLKAKQAFSSVLSITACPFYKDADGLAKWLEKGLIALGSANKVDEMVKKAATPGLAPSHTGAILQAAAIMVKSAGKPVPASLSGALKKMLGSNDPATLKQGIRLAGTLKYKPAEALIVNQLTSQDKSIRKAAATALVFLGNPKGIVPLLEMSKSNATLLNNTTDLIEKAGFADEARLWHAKQQAKDFDKQTEYLEKMGAFK